MTSSTTPVDHQALMVGISGCSSSGKTTLARLLRDLFPRTFILHEDDFYRAESELPVHPSGHLDWDCPEAINVPQMADALAYIRAHGELPVSLRHGDNESRTNHGVVENDVRYLPERPGRDADAAAAVVPEKSVLEESADESGEEKADGHDDISYFPPSSTANNTTLDPSPLSSPSESMARVSPDPSLCSHASSSSEATPLTPAPCQQPTLDSKEDQNAIGVVPVRKSVLDEMRDRVQSWLANLPRDVGMPKICVIDGFLLYTPALEPVPRHLDLRLFLVVSREKAIRRREARDGYVTLEGFWKDPPGYVEQIVWPNYASSHAWMFESGDAERGVLDTAKLEGKSIRAQTDKGIDVDMEITLDWAVHEVMRAVEGFMGIQK